MELVKRLGLQIFVLVQWVVSLIAAVVGRSEKRCRVPPIENELLSFSATQLAEKIRASEITSEELVSAYIKRIEAVNPIINAVVENRFSEAIADAKNVDEYLKHYKGTQSDLARSRPLLGVPITVKESIAVKGMSFTWCSLVRKGVKAEEDATVVTALREAGAIILLVSTTPEYCSAIETNNNLIGMTKNPYDTRRVCGGSSGGEGALLGAGASVVGIGSDIAGSIRIPCAFNGIYGHKPTAGIVPLEGVFPLCDDKRKPDHLVVGPMTRYVEDLKLTLKILAGSKSSQLNLDQKVDPKDLKLFYMVDSWSEFGLSKVDKQIKQAIQDGVGYLSKTFGCPVDETKFPEMGSSFECIGLVFKMKDLAFPFTDLNVDCSAKNEFLKFLVGRSIFCFQSFVFRLLASLNFMVTEEEEKIYTKMLADFKEKFVSILGENGVFLYPSYPTAAFKHHGFISGMQGARFAAICNLLGCPSTCVPIGLNEDGLPLGIQVIAAPYKDNLTLEVAKELGRYYGGWRAPK